jgi:DNA-binding MarR family transcriptional regulator
MLINQGGSMPAFKASQEAGYLLKRAQQAIRKKMDASLKPLDLTTPQYSILSQLFEFPGLSNAELARKSFVAAQTMNLVVQGLEKRGLIRRKARENQGRIMTTDLTKEGRKLLAAANERVLAVEKEIFSELKPDEIETLSSLLRKVGENPDSIP